MEAIEYAFENLQTPNGLLHWGGHQAYDAMADKPRGKWIHECKGFYPCYQLMWEVDPQATERFIEAFWSGHILDWSNLDMDRHCYDMNEPLEKPWDYEYKGGPVFFESNGASFHNAGSDLFYAAAILSSLSGGKEQSLVWAKRLAYRYVEARNPRTAISNGMFTVGKGQGYQAQSNDETLNKLVPDYVFPMPRYANRSLWECHFGYEMPTPGIILNGVTAPWLCQLMLGELLGEDGEEFTEWTVEELTAWGKVAYRSRDNAFIPMSLDGTSFEGYVCEEDGPLGFKGTTLEPVSEGHEEIIKLLSKHVVKED